MKKKYILSTLLASSLLLVACQPEKKEAAVEEAAKSSQTYEAQTLKEKPRLQDDFYSYINYDYLKETELPAGFSSMDNMGALSLEARERMQDIIKDLDANYDKLEEGSDEKKIIDFYRMAADFSKRDELGLAPIQETLDEIKAAKSLDDLNKFMVDNATEGYAFMINTEVSQDLRDNSKNILYVGEAKEGLDQNYYDGKDEFSEQVRKAYKTFLSDSFKLMGYSEKEAKKKAEAVYEFEKAMIANNKSPEEKKDFNVLYNEMSFEDFYAIASNLPYKQIFEELDLAKADKLVVTEPKAIETVNGLYVDENLDTIKSFMEMKVLKNNSSNLSKDVLKVGTKYLAAYTGTDHLDDDATLAFQLLEGNFGELLGKLYVEKYFSPEVKEDILGISQEIVDTYKERVKAVDWLTEATKAKAIKKLDTLTLKIGYPDKWTDYSDIKVVPYADGGNLVMTTEAVGEHKLEKKLDSLNQAPDKSTWHTTPQTVNAFYNAAQNEILFTAVILQAPFYSKDATRAENIGGIGSVIGHEISHALDSTGSQFDENGDLNNWWTEEDLVKFQAKVKQSADIYSKLEVVKGHFVNGDISTGEIMADLGGLTVALEIAKKENLNLKEVFESYAQVWRGVNTKEALISNLTDEHPRHKFRINNIVNLMDDFYTEYDVKEGDKMYVAPEDRLKVW